MFACRLLVGFALATGVSGYFHASEPAPPCEPTCGVSDFDHGGATVQPTFKSSSEQKSKAYNHYARGQYKEALAAYIRWTPMSRCGHGAVGNQDDRYEHIALCHAHLNNHLSAVGACLDLAGRETWANGTLSFLVQLYREAGQLDDLAPLLDAIERRVLAAKHPKPWLLLAEERVKLLGLRGTYVVRRQLKAAQLDTLPPWPDGVPKPKPGSLPKTLPK